MENLLNKYASPKNIWLLVLVVAGFNIGLGFYFSDLHGTPLDVIPYYTPDQAYESMDNYGEAGRELYIKGTILLDFVYPPVYCTMLALALYRAYSNTRIVFLPLAILIVDYLENGTLLYLLASFPDRYESLAAIAGVFTSLKWVMVITALLLIFYPLVAKKLRFKSAKPPGA